MILNFLVFLSALSALVVTFIQALFEDYLRSVVINRKCPEFQQGVITHQDVRFDLLIDSNFDILQGVFPDPDFFQGDHGFVCN